MDERNHNHVRADTRLWGNTHLAQTKYPAGDKRGHVYVGRVYAHEARSLARVYNKAHKQAGRGTL